jgi:hypothetical protein
VNCFTHRTISGFPAENIQFVVFGVLTGGAGDIALDLVIHGLDGFDEVNRRSTSFHFPGPLREVRYVCRIRSCIFPSAGHYEAVLWADNELMAQRRFHLASRESST